MMKSGARHGASRGWRAAAAGALLGVIWAANPASAALHISAAPTDIDWTSNAWVNVTVSNLTLGSKVNLGLYVDVQGNGVLDDADMLLAVYRVQDGVTNPFGSSVIVLPDQSGAIKP